MQGFGHYLKHIYTHRFLFKPATKEHRQIMMHKEEYQTKMEDIAHFFVSMSSDMSIILMHHLSALRLPNAHRTEYISLMISRDPTNAFFDSNAHQPVLSNPINSLPSHQALCLIDTFFHIHPHSFMLSKSELLKAYWSDTTDPLLLSVIYGSALFMSRVIDGQSLNLFETHNLEVRNPFLDYAHQLLSQLPEEITLSRYQAVVLLGMFEAMYGYSKKGISLFILSYMMVEKLGLFDPTVSQTPLQKELLGITFWSVFQCTARGYVELLKLNFHQFPPYPPMNLMQSLSTEADANSTKLRSYKESNQLVETFYIQCVITRLCYDLLLVLLEHKEQVNQRLENTMKEFRRFIEKNRHQFSKLQELTLEVYCSFYIICLGFLKDSVSQGNFNIQRPSVPQDLDLTHPNNIQNVFKALPEAMSALDKIANFLNGDPTHYYSESTFLPRSIITATLDAVTRVLMYHYTLQPTSSVRKYLELVEIILYNPDLWIRWELTCPIRYDIQKFLQMHPVSSSNSSSNSSSPLTDMSSFHWIDSLFQESFQSIDTTTTDWSLPMDSNINSLQITRSQKNKNIAQNNTGRTFDT
ncbi:unnamed protein product [Rhizopus stolonifer]